MSITRQQLFRPEALQAREELWLGRHTLALGLPATATSIISVILTAAIAALLVLGAYARRIDLHGMVLPENGLIRVTSPVAGRVESIAVQDGRQVAEGTVLYVVNLDTATNNGSTQQQILASLAKQRNMLTDQIDRKQRMQAEQDQLVQRKVDNLDEQINQLGVQITVKQRFVDIDTKIYNDFTRFQKQGIDTLSITLMHQQNWMHAVEDLEEMKSRALRLRAQWIDARSQQRTAHLQSSNEIDALRSQIAGLDQQVTNAEAHRSVEVRAPGAGIVTAIQLHAGQLVANGESMLTIVPARSKMQAELLAPSTSIGFLRKGQRVLLRYSAFPFQRFGQYWGTVTDVSLAALSPDELKQVVPALPAVDQAKTFYRVTVMPDRQNVTVYGRSEPLQASMQVDARVVLDKRRLYQWLLDPLYSLRGSRSS